jgi:hypothetical protein
MRLLTAALVIFLVGACASAGPELTVSAVRVAGVLLVPAEPSLRASCARAATLGGFVVPCPRLVIAHRAAIGESCPDRDRPNAGGKDCLADSAAGNPDLPSLRDAFMYTQNDVVLDGALHLFVFGVKRDSRLLASWTGCGGSEGTPSAGPDLSGIATSWIECSGEIGGGNSGHVLLRWTRGDVVYAVSLHGHTQVNRDVELAIAQNIEYIAP